MAPTATRTHVRRTAPSTSTAHSLSYIDRKYREEAPEWPVRTERTQRVRRTTPSRTRRLGSRQQVSIRGRRIADTTDKSRAVRMLALPLLAFVIGIGVVMWISGLTTAQTFQISAAQKQSTTLSNEIESLQRDLEDASSGASIAKKARDLGMVAPDQSGVLDANGADVQVVRQPGVGTDREITDINSDSRSRGATSNPDRTKHVEGLAPEEAVVAGVGADIRQPASGAQNPTDLPYSNSRDNARPAPAAPPAPPAPAPGSHSAADPVAPPA